MDLRGVDQEETLVDRCKELFGGLAEATPGLIARGLFRRKTSRVAQTIIVLPKRLFRQDADRKETPRDARREKNDNLSAHNFEIAQAI